MSIDLGRALLRGRFMRAAAEIEHAGVPIDVELLERLNRGWPRLMAQLIERVDQQYGVYEGLTFKAKRFAEWLAREGIPWPQLESGSLSLSDKTFEEMARAFPQVALLHELRSTLSRMRLSALAVGADGRNRCLLSAFSSRTGRNQPSTTGFIFGLSAWLRGLIKPRPGYGLAYIDWSQQEFGVAAALSGDAKMQAAYTSGDPYLEFAKQAGAVPSDATKRSHPLQREQFKACVLAVNYGMGQDSLAMRIGQPVSRARELLRLHRETYDVFWTWSDAAVDHAMLRGRLNTVFGWNVHTGQDANARFFRNFPMQANGAELLRLACCFAVESEIRVCAPVHDAILIEAPLHRLDEDVARTQALMIDASLMVLGGFSLRSDVKLVRYPERYVDERGVEMWDDVMSLLDQVEAEPDLGIHTRATCASTPRDV